MNDEYLQSIDQKLTTVIKLLAVNAVKEKDDDAQMAFLKTMGLKSAEIGAILNKPSSTIRRRLTQKKKQKRK